MSNLSNLQKLLNDNYDVFQNGSYKDSYNLISSYIKDNNIMYDEEAEVQGLVSFDMDGENGICPATNEPHLFTPMSASNGEDGIAVFICPDCGDAAFYGSGYAYGFNDHGNSGFYCSALISNTEQDLFFDLSGTLDDEEDIAQEITDSAVSETVETTPIEPTLKRGSSLGAIGVIVGLTCIAIALGVVWFRNKK